MENVFHLNENEEMLLSTLAQVQRLTAMCMKNPMVRVEYIRIHSK